MITGEDILRCEEEMGMDNKLFILTRTTKFPKYDVVRQMVIRASDEDNARLIASENALDEGPLVWMDRLKSTCVRLHPNGMAGLVIKDGTNG